MGFLNVIVLKTLFLSISALKTMQHKAFLSMRALKALQDVGLLSIIALKQLQNMGFLSIIALALKTLQGVGLLSIIALKKLQNMGFLSFIALSKRVVEHHCAGPSMQNLENDAKHDIFMLRKTSDFEHHCTAGLESWQWHSASEQPAI